MDGKDETLTVARLEAELAIERARREAAEQLAEERAHRIEDLSLSLRMLEASPKRYWVAGMFTLTLSAVLLGYMPTLVGTGAPAIVIIVGSFVGMGVGLWLLASTHSTR
ncbi:MAG: hypothetical protein M3O70_25745 [Actinomycetota bacterium]|nr:hypothetical protein [Actinomycetota bacterium]